MIGGPSPAADQHGEAFTVALLDATPDAILVIDGAGTIVFLNRRAGELFGYDHDDLLGRVVEDLMPDDDRTVHRAHRTRYRADPTIRPMGAGLVLRARRADGSELPVEISLSPLLIGDVTYSVAAVRDVTDRVQAEDHLHRVLTTLDASDDGVFIFDAATLRYSYVNEGAVRLVGYDAEDLLTMTPLHLNPNATIASYRELVDRLQAEQGTSVIQRSTLLRKDGREVPVEKTFQAAPVGRDGSRWVVVLARDVTKSIRAEEELLHSRDALRAAEQVVAVADERERIARDLHDTVIQRLFGAGLHLQATAAMSDERIQGRIAATIEDLDETIKELRMAIFSLQGVAAASPGGMRGRILDVVGEAGDSLGFEPRLQFDGAIESIDETVMTELVPTLREALANVARHAKARSARVTVSVDRDVTLVVTDDGIGIPAEVIGGRGLENMVRRADRAGGTALVRPIPSGGTELIWTVPGPRSTSSIGRPDPARESP